MLFMRQVSILEEDSVAKLGMTLGNPWGPRGACPTKQLMIDSDRRSPAKNIIETHTSTQVLTYSVLRNRAT